jgi:site-specific DNA-adenine methylase
LNKMDQDILKFYSEVRDNLDELIDLATGPHHLFHALTEEPEVRLHMTRRLIETANKNNLIN